MLAAHCAALHDVQHIRASNYSCLFRTDALAWTACHRLGRTHCLQAHNDYVNFLPVNWQLLHALMLGHCSLHQQYSRNDVASILFAVIGIFIGLSGRSSCKIAAQGTIIVPLDMPTRLRP